VVICTYKRPKALERALGSLRRQSLAPGRYETIVVDNSPEDGRARQILEEGAGGDLALTYCAESRPGLSRARNKGIEAARAPAIAFIDDDAEAGGSWLESLVDAFNAEKTRPLAVGGPVKPVWNSRCPSWLPPTFLTTLSLVDYGPNRRRLDFPAEFVVGCNVAFESGFLRQVGGFDLALGRRGARLFGNEDTYLLGRIRSAGGLVLYEPAALVYHHIPPERERLSWFLRRMYFQGYSDAIMESECSPPLVAQTMHERLRSHFGPSLSRVRSNPSHAAFTLAMAAAYGSGRVAKRLQGTHREGSAS
jgi:glycosyltransferase involved in cell wall biosynthesis